MNKIIHSLNLTKIYGDGDNEVKALDDVSFSIERGQVVLIVGDSSNSEYSYFCLKEIALSATHDNINTCITMPLHREVV